MLTQGIPSSEFTNFFSFEKLSKVRFWYRPQLLADLEDHICWRIQWRSFFNATNIWKIYILQASPAQWDFHKRFQFLRICSVSILVSHMFGNWNFRQFYCRAIVSMYLCPLKLLIRHTFHFHKDWITPWQLFKRFMFSF